METYFFKIIWVHFIIIVELFNIVNSRTHDFSFFTHCSFGRVETLGRSFFWIIAIAGSSHWHSSIYLWVINSDRHISKVNYAFLLFESYIWKTLCVWVRDCKRVSSSSFVDVKLTWLSTDFHRSSGKWVTTSHLRARIIKSIPREIVLKLLVHCWFFSNPKTSNGCMCKFFFFITTFLIIIFFKSSGVYTYLFWIFQIFFAQKRFSIVCLMSHSCLFFVIVLNI